MTTPLHLKSIIKLSLLLGLTLFILASNLLALREVRAASRPLPKRIPASVLTPTATLLLPNESPGSEAALAALQTTADDTPVGLNRQESSDDVTAQIVHPADLTLTVSRAGLRPELTSEYIEYIAGHEVKHGDRTRPAVALTFDCEGNAAQIQKMVTLLDAGGVKGTFFLLGDTVAQAPEVVPVIRAGGHDVGNHSYSHPRFTTLTQTEVISEVMLAEQAISAAAGEPLPMRYFRFPYGDRNQEIKNWLADLGYQSIFWDIDPQGWRAEITSSQVISTVVNQAQPGSIVLLHCGRTADEEALPVIIAALKAQGYALETLSGILPH